MEWDQEKEGGGGGGGLTNDQENVWNTNMLSFKSSRGTGEREQRHCRIFGVDLLQPESAFIQSIESETGKVTKVHEVKRVVLGWWWH